MPLLHDIINVIRAHRRLLLLVSCRKNTKLSGTFNRIYINPFGCLCQLKRCKFPHFLATLRELQVEIKKRYLHIYRARFYLYVITYIFTLWYNNLEIKQRGCCRIRIKSRYFPKNYRIILLSLKTLASYNSFELKGHFHFLQIILIRSKNLYNRIPQLLVSSLSFLNFMEQNNSKYSFLPIGWYMQCINMHH